MKRSSILGALCALLIVPVVRGEERAAPGAAGSRSEEAPPALAAAPAPAEAAPADKPVTLREEVVVTATRGEKPAVEVPASTVSLEMNQLQLDGFYAGGDELRGQPGLFFRRGEGDNDDFMFVNFRGITGNHGNDTFLALIDGIPFVSANNEVQLSQLPYPAVGTIEIVRGPVSALYGRGGLAGAINYLTRVPVDRSTEVRLFAGSDTYLGGDVALTRPIGDHTRLLLSANGLYGDGWREHNERRSAGFFAKSISQLGPASLLTLWANALDKRYETGSAIPTYEDGTLVDVKGGRTGFIGGRDTFSDIRMLFTAGRLDQKLSDRWSLQATLHYRALAVENRLDFYDSFGFQPERNVVTWNGFGSEQDPKVASARCWRPTARAASGC
jgi:iron complex outermembrane receptor protein